MFRVEYNFGFSWNEYKSFDSMYEAKKARNALKKQFGKEAKVRIITI